MLISGPGLAPSVLFNASGASPVSKKVRDVSKGWGVGGSLEEHSYDVSRGQNRYVTLPLLSKLNI